MENISASAFPKYDLYIYVKHTSRSTMHEYWILQLQLKHMVSNLIYTFQQQFKEMSTCLTAGCHKSLFSL